MGWICSWQIGHVSSRSGAGPACDLMPSISGFACCIAICVLEGLCGRGSSSGVGSGGLEPRVGESCGVGGVLIAVGFVVERGEADFSGSRDVSMIRYDTSGRRFLLPPYFV